MASVRVAEAAAKRKATPPIAAGKQAPRDAEKTRLKILAAAETEFAQKGLAGARVDTIAEESGANKRMIYYYFNSKEELYIAVLERAYADMRSSERDLELEHLDPLDAIRRLTEFKFDYCVAHPTLIHLLNGENMLDAAYLKQSRRLREMQVSLVKRLDALLRCRRREGRHAPGHRSAASLHLDLGAELFLFLEHADAVDGVRPQSRDAGGAQGAPPARGGRDPGLCA